MLIGIDGNEANVINKVGVNQYAFELLWALRKLQDEKEIKHEFVIYLKDAPLEGLPKPREGWKYEVIVGGRLWILRHLMPHLYSTHRKPDVFFSPNHYIPPFAPMPRVVAIMDLGYLASPEQFKPYDFWQLKLWTAWSLFWSKKILAISQATQKDIVKHYPLVSKNIVVTMLAGDSSVENHKITSENLQMIANKYLIVKDYVLFLSTLKPSKNLIGLLEAWAKVVRVFGNKLCLVVAGKKGWLYEPIFERVKKLGLEKHVIFTDFVPEEDKASLIKGAKIFVLPSFWEGFGIDVVNAMKLGVPVVVSDRGSLPEVAGSLGKVVDPTKPDKIAEAIVEILKLPKKDYNKLSAQCIDYAKRFSWEITAQNTIKALESAK